MKALLAVMAVMPGLAWAHGDAAWIQQNPRTTFCCGVEDCQVVRPVEATDRGWRFINPHTDKAVTVGFESVNRFDSIDQQFWACFMLHDPKKTLRCFFTPGPGI